MKRTLPLRWRSRDELNSDEMNLDTPLPNPVSPKQDTFLKRLLSTWKTFSAVRKQRNGQGSPSAPQDSTRPKLSVMLITYNHGKYIVEALDSIIRQKRDFSMEINVIDDASTDDTQKIVLSYAHKYPGLINCYFNLTNAGHVATQLNTIRGFCTLRGEYFSILEGDDYWTDDEKIIKQLRFLDKSPDYVACAHYTKRVFEDGRPDEHFLPVSAFNREDAESSDLISMSAVFHLSSIVYRNIFGQSPPACFYDPFSCEATINSVYGMYGKFRCFSEYMSNYRTHDGGVFSSKRQEDIWNFHLGGFRRFSLYLAPAYWLQFAYAVKRFSLYVLLAPFKTKEVTSLHLKTYLNFLLHFLVAATICISADLVRSLRRLAPKTIIKDAMSIEQFGPQPVSRKAAFNVQPGGCSAIWIRTNEALSGETYLVFGGRKIPATVEDSLVTALIPKRLTARRGVIPFWLEVSQGREIRLSKKAWFSVI